jgi:hypothetical protein
MKAIICATLALAGLAGATPITFTLSTTGSGNFNGTAFGDNTLTFTQVTDTASLVVCGTLLICGPDVASTNTVTISGVGGGIISDFSFIFVDSTNSVVSFFDDTTVANLLAESDPSFAAYNMQSAFGPVFDTVGNHTFTNLATSAGNLTFTGNSLDATFTATTTGSATPEPGSLGLMFFGALGLHVWRSRIVRRGYDLSESGSDRHRIVTGGAGDASGDSARRQ